MDSTGAFQEVARPRATIAAWRPVLGPAPGRDEYRLAGLVHDAAVPDPGRIDHGLARPQFDHVLLAVQVLDEIHPAGEQHDHLLTGRMPFPARPGAVLRAHHDQAALVAVGGMLFLVPG